MTRWHGLNRALTDVKPAQQRGQNSRSGLHNGLSPGRGERKPGLRMAEASFAPAGAGESGRTLNPQLTLWSCKSLKWRRHTCLQPIS